MNIITTDHQGNLRLAFRKVTTGKYVGTMERENRTAEEVQGFAGLHAGSSERKYRGGTSQKLTGNRRGMEFRKTVRQGDIISVKVYALDEDATTQGGVPIGDLQVGVTNTLGSSSTDGSSSPGSFGLGLTYQLGQRPIVVNEDFSLHLHVYDEQGSKIDEQEVHMGEVVNEQGWQELKLRDYVAGQAGEIEAFVHYNGADAVWFDDLTIRVQHLTTTQEEHYAPFGQTLAGIDKSGVPNYPYQFNGQSEHEEYADLHWYQTPFRPYDPQLGRFWGVDLLADDFASVSPMQFAFNNPLSFNDPTGLCADCPLPTQYLDEITVTAGRISDPGRFTSANIGFSFPRPDFSSLFRATGFVAPSFVRYPLSKGTIIGIEPVYPQDDKTLPVYTIEGGEIVESDWSALLGYTGVISGITERSITQPLSYDLMTLKQLSKIGGATAALTSVGFDALSLRNELQQNREISSQSLEKAGVNTVFTLVGFGKGLGFGIRGLGFTISAVYFAGSQLKEK